MRFRFAPMIVLLLFVASLPAVAQWHWGRPHPPRAGACFYRDTEFRGDFFCMRAGERWPSLPSGFNDRISSIRLFGGARLRIFNDGGFHGANVLLDGDVDDLRRIPVPDNRHKNWNDRISSVAVFFPGRDEWGDHRDHEDRRDWDDRDHR